MGNLLVQFLLDSEATVSVVHYEALLSTPNLMTNSTTPTAVTANGAPLNIYWVKLPFQLI